jgi:hypothetical protein
MRNTVLVTVAIGFVVSCTEGPIVDGQSTSRQAIAEFPCVPSDTCVVVESPCRCSSVGGYKVAVPAGKEDQVEFNVFCTHASSDSESMDPTCLYTEAVCVDGTCVLTSPSP